MAPGLIVPTYAGDVGEKHVTSQGKFGWTIPDDWDEEEDGFLCYGLCVPNSRGWRTIFDGLISSLAYGRNWNKTTGTITEAQAVSREIYENMCAAKCDDILITLDQIAVALTKLADGTDVEDQGVDAPSSDGDVATGEGEQFPTSDAYFDAKCAVANSIFDTTLGTVTWLKDNSSDLIDGAFGGVTSGLLLGLKQQGALGWAVSKVGAAMGILAALITRVTVPFDNLEDALLDVHEEAVVGLFNAQDAKTARASFIAVVDASAFPLSDSEEEMLEIILTSEMLNQLFQPRDDIAKYASPSPVDCGAAILEVWTFPVDEESWTFQDGSTANASAAGSYSASEKALLADQIILAGGSFRITRAVNVSPVISVAAVSGNSVQWDYSAPSDGVVVFRTLTVFFDDATEQEITKSGHTTAGTLVLTLENDKTIEGIECLTGRSNGSSTSGWQFETLTFEVRIIGS